MAAVVGSIVAAAAGRSSLDLRIVAAGNRRRRIPEALKTSSYQRSCLRNLCSSLDRVAVALAGRTARPGQVARTLLVVHMPAVVRMQVPVVHTACYLDSSYRLHRGS